MEQEAVKSAADQMGLTLVNDSRDWISQLEAEINHLLVHDFNRLIALLYRLDVSETRIRSTLQDQPASDAAHLLAALVVERQVQKLKSRQQMRRDDISSIDEDDRW